MQNRPAPGHLVQRQRARAAMAAAHTGTGLPAAPAAAVPAIAINADTGPHPQGAATGGSRWWAPRPRSAGADTLRHLPLQRGQSRELARTNPIAAGAINTNVDRIVGTGIALSANPNRFILGWSADQAAEWKQKTQAEFSLWADSTACDHAAAQTFYELQALVLRAVKESGDAFSLLPNGPASSMMPYRLRIQVLEADRVGNPQGQMDTGTIAGGIRTNTRGAPEACYIYNQHPGAAHLSGSPYAGEWVEYLGPSGRHRVLHHYRKLRPEQPRGIPYLAPIVDLIKQIGRYTEAEISAAVVSAYFTVFVEGTNTGDPGTLFDAPPGTSTASGAAASAASEIGLGMGTVVGLNPGEKVNFANPSRPNPNFDGFITAMLRQVGMALGLPVELLIKQFNGSYSASKAAILDAWIYIRSERVWLSNSFCQPIYNTWLGEAVATGRIAAPGFFADPMLRWAYTRASWHGDSMGSINPKDEVAAYTAAVEARLMTRERAEWELFGSDFNETTAQKAAEEALLQTLGITPVPKAGTAPQPAQTPATP